MNEFLPISNPTKKAMQEPGFMLGFSFMQTHIYEHTYINNSSIKELLIETICLGQAHLPELSQQRTWCCSQKLTGRSQEGPKEGGDNQPPRVLLFFFFSQSPSCRNRSWLRDAPPGRTLNQTMGQARQLARDNLETNAISINPESSSHEAEQFWVSLPSCPPPKCPSQ